MDIYLHTKNKAGISYNLGDIQDYQSCNLTGQEHFCLYFENQNFPKHGVSQNLTENSHASFKRKKKIHINGLNFSENPKNPIFGVFWVFFPKRLIFPKTPASSVFYP